MKPERLAEISHGLAGHPWRTRLAWRVSVWIGGSSASRWYTTGELVDEVERLREQLETQEVNFGRLLNRCERLQRENEQVVLANVDVGMMNLEQLGTINDLKAELDAKGGE